MNLSISNPAIDSNWKRFKVHYLAAACGVALAAVGAAGLGGIRSNDSFSAGPASAPAPAVKLAASHAAPQTFLIVGSAEERDRLQRSLESDSHNWAPGVQYHVLFAENDAQAGYIAWDIHSADPNRVVTDIRVAPVASVTGVQPDSAERAALVTAQEQFMVGIIPQDGVTRNLATERAAYVTTQEQFIVGLVPSDSAGVTNRVATIAEIMKRPSLPARHHMFVVASQADAEVLRQAIFEHSQYADDATREVVVVDNAYTRSVLDQTLNEMIENGISVTVYGY